MRLCGEGQGDLVCQQRGITRLPVWVIEIGKLLTKSA